MTPDELETLRAALLADAAHLRGNAAYWEDAEPIYLIDVAERIEALLGTAAGSPVVPDPQSIADADEEEQALAAELAAVIAAREADGAGPAWVERWGDLTSPERGSDPWGIRR